MFSTVTSVLKYNFSSCFVHFSFAKQYNSIIETVVKNRKMWMSTNESWMNINDNDVDDLPGFAKKLEEQKVVNMDNCD